MILLLSLVLGILPLLGVVWIFVSGMITIAPPSATVDGLFMTLILLTLSLCFLLNAFWEARDQGMLKFLQKKKVVAPAPAATTKPATAAAAAPAAKAPASKVTS
jgi:hypothetical protein